RIDQLDQLLHSLARPLETADEQVEQELVTLAVTVARQLVRRELQTSPDEIVAVVREALGVLPSHSNDIRVVMHPDDAQLVREVLSDTAQERAWRIVEDPALTRGGCRIDTDVSRVDATLEHRLNQVIASVWGDARTGGGG
ncbi:MAG: flagellar assembly protein FliH, partial [Acidihalobacter sp.]